MIVLKTKQKQRKTFCKLCDCWELNSAVEVVLTLWRKPSAYSRGTLTSTD